MELILWRHAEAEDGVPDTARKLTNKGLNQAKSMADWLKLRLPEDTRVIVSPAQRTQQTAMAFKNNFETMSEIGPGADASMILTIADWPHADKTVLIVGHQPTLGETAALLMSNKSMNVSFKKGAIWWFSYKSRQGVAQTVLRTVISPEML
ncbi:phosphohistidine phosphatase, SixA [Nitrosomonas cryotolerans]|uniref:Phosphohistidine phosphatase, SixA n=1 Tax=Nitrosomonas cryotolerans ATCC 49181 TaxID=1131553 RepID=A0A1N6J0Y7_9PROT|nr:phosphohistidine phosphatase SixA [Nitrosomonas cryotolerans]SFP53906.1 phosphohistidine phosphatase, SixA [Nitrosomonas cryotolerans]SIO37922.1 phosphohistidine phosphatase, SixA [Nitrosomonas cryotolerans ATCC 49181]